MTLDDWTKLAEILTLVALIAGGVFALRRYRYNQRLRAAEFLLSVEPEFRAIFPTCMEFEEPNAYQQALAPLLEKVANNAALDDAERKKLQELDRCLRFFYLCTVLHADLKIEQGALLKAYYYYLRVLADPGERPELRKYVAKFYPRLSQFIDKNKQALKCLGERP